MEHHVDLATISASNVVSAARSPEQFAAQLRRPMPTRPNRAARRGTRFHAFVEQHYARAAMLDWDELPGSADDDMADPDEAQLATMKAHFLGSEWAERTPLAIETAVETVLPTSVGPVSVRGRIDAVFARDDESRSSTENRGPGPSTTSGPSRPARRLCPGLAAIHDLPAELVDVAFTSPPPGDGPSALPGLDDSSTSSTVWNGHSGAATG